MRKFRKILLWVILVIAVIAGGIWFWLYQSSPKYSGELALKGLQDEVSVWFDDYGIPHIEAKNKHDLYLTFGYIHAQERLFQMELLKRAGGGRLAEVLGEDLLKTDIMFRSLGLATYAEESAELLDQSSNTQLKADVEAYLEGINQYIQTGSTPPEFSILGLKKEPFTKKDMFLVSGAMAFSFSQGQKTDFILDDIKNRFGNKYLEDLSVYHLPDESWIRTFDQSDSSGVQADTTVSIPDVFSEKCPSPSSPSPMIGIAAAFDEIHAALPFAPLQGSNSWVVGGKKTASHEVLFCNDTHIGYLLPQTWYEAHLMCPGFEMYGHFMAGIPFALVGRNRNISWGLTMLLNDDMDFFREKIKPDADMAVQFGDHWEAMDIHPETISIQGKADTVIQVKHTRHGPIINEIFDGMEKLDPISMTWTYTQLPNHTFEAFYGMNNAHDINSFEEHLDLIHAPGLSVNYGDKDGNIAWWACAKLLRRKDDINSLTILDGARGFDEYLGYYPFSENPRTINPEWGYIYSANDWPGQVDSAWYPGYYKPQYRADRIRDLIEQHDDWDVEKMKVVMTDAVMIMDSIIFGELKSLMNEQDTNEFIKSVINASGEWNGNYAPADWEPTFYNRWLYHTMNLACADEMGKKGFSIFCSTHQFQRSYSHLLRTEDSKWWDDINTEKAESRSEIVNQALRSAIDELKKAFGDDFAKWSWERSTSLELEHPFGKISFLRPFFNVGPYPAWGGNETILQAGFKPDSTLHNKVYFGSQMRIIFDFQDPANGLNITPCGQSGHLLSPHYSDQAELYREKQFRPMVMDSTAYREGKILLFLPE